jgi:hypothetical protein
MWRGLRRHDSSRLFDGPWCHGNGLVRTSMRNTSTGIGKPSFLKLPGFPIVPPPFNVKGRRPIPRLIGVGVCISELLLGAQAIRKFVKLYVGLHRRHAANQNDQNPFHQIHHALPPEASVRVRNYQTSGGFHHKPNERRARVLPFACQAAFLTTTAKQARREGRVFLGLCPAKFSCLVDDEADGLYANYLRFSSAAVLR